MANKDEVTVTLNRNDWNRVLTALITRAFHLSNENYHNAKEFYVELHDNVLKQTEGKGA